jgi:predicted Zn-dependent protease with MMP-like domain
MIEVSDDDFEAAIAKAMDSLSKQMAEVKNVGIVMADEPTPEQRRKLELRNDQSLFGLYEGIPLTKRGGNYSGVLPDKITLFKLPLTWAVSSYAEFEEQVRHTLWHELAHHFGLDHDGIERRE